MNKNIVFILLLTATSLFAKFDEPFSKLELGVSVGSEIAENQFHDFWEKGNSIKTNLSTPYYYGSFELGIMFSRYIALDNNSKDFDAVSISIGWGNGWNLIERIEWYNSASFANNIMNIKFKTENVSESEISLNFVSQLKYNIYRNTKIYSGIEYSRIYTFHKVNHLHYFVGLSHTIDTPKFIKKFLK